MALISLDGRQLLSREIIIILPYNQQLAFALFRFSQ